MSESKLAEEMDREVVNLLRAYKSPTCLYAAKRIEQLGQLLISTTKALDVSGRFVFQARRERDVYFQIAADCIGDAETENLARRKLAEMKQEKHVYPGKAVIPPHTVIDGDSENE